MALLFLLLVRFLNADIVAEELDLDETGKAAGDLFGVKLFQQSTICDIGGDDGGQLCAQPVVQQAVQIGEKEAGIELGAKIIEDQQVGLGCSLEQRFFLAVRVGAEMQRFQLAKEIRDMRNIRDMFLLESGFIGFMGGVAGIILSLTISFLINRFVGAQALTGMPGDLSRIPLWLNAAALCFAVFVGMAAGFLPATRAMKLSPLAAIRNE